MVIVNKIDRYEVVDFSHVKNIRSLPLGFRWEKTGLAYLLNDSDVIIPYLCNRANSTSRSSLRLSGAGRL